MILSSCEKYNLDFISKITFHYIHHIGVFFSMSLDAIMVWNCNDHWNVSKSKLCYDRKTQWSARHILEYNIFNKNPKRSNKKIIFYWKDFVTKKKWSSAVRTISSIWYVILLLLLFQFSWYFLHKSTGNFFWYINLFCP